MTAGCHDSSLSTTSLGRSSSVRARASAVSRPSIPGGAWSKGSSLRWGAWGAWSVAMASSTPSARPAFTAATSAGGRSGGVALYNRGVEGPAAAGGGARRGVDLEPGVVGGAARVGEGEGVGRGFGRARHPAGPGGPHHGHAARRREVLEVHTGAGETGEGNVAHDHQLLRLGRLARDA